MHLAIEKILRNALLEEPKGFAYDESRQPTEWVIPPFLGEPSHEILLFLGMVAPWLRNGWKIPARRPELYPSGATIELPGLFADIDRLLLEYGAKPSGCLLTLPRPNAAWEASTAIHGQEEPEKDLEFELNVTIHDQQKITDSHNFEVKLRRMVGQYILNADRPHILWDDYLLKERGALGDGDYFALDIEHPLIPMWYPEDYQKGGRTLPRHIGLSQSAHDNLGTAIARLAAQEWQIPLFIYSDQSGPESTKSKRAEAEANGQGQWASDLSFQLQGLASCVAMISEDDDWADLMAWLQVPSLVICDSVASVHHRRRSQFKSPMIMADVSSFRTPRSVEEWRHDPRLSSLIKLTLTQLFSLKPNLYRPSW